MAHRLLEKLLNVWHRSFAELGRIHDYHQRRNAASYAGREPPDT